jgi:ubiquinone biosynthesis protein
MTVFRLIKILVVFKSYGIISLLNNFKSHKYYLHFINLILFIVPAKHKSKSPAVRLRLALEALGPIYVKFGQILSTRADILPDNYVKELEHLQYQVPPFDSAEAKLIIERNLGQKIEELFSEFTINAVASASIAQVHKARLRLNGQEVAIKICRPHIKATICQDIALLKLCAAIAQKLLRDGQQLRLIEVVEEFEHTIFAELDFSQELANNLELSRLHKYDNKIVIPIVYPELSTDNVLVMQWMHGIAINNLQLLKASKVNLQRLSTNGIEIFYNQVFNFGFFHADMHPGNVLCSPQGQFILLDFGIVGYLSDEDKRYLAINILAFFNRDYRKVAVTHVESGWAPSNTNITQFERAIRIVCEPIFNKPLAQISFAQVLIKLFQVSRQFGIVVQPQLLLLQKTIVNIESLGRLINPELDLWITAKPILNDWVKKQMGFKSFLYHFQQELPYLPALLPSLPRELQKTLKSLQQQDHINQQLIILINKNNKHNFIIYVCLLIMIILLLYTTKS